MLQSEMCPNLADICLLLFSRTYGTYSGVVSALVSARIWFHPVWRGHLRSGKCLFYVLIVTLHTSTKFSQTINSEVITYLLILYLCYHSCKRVHCTPCNHSGSQAHKHSQHSLFQSPERDLLIPLFDVMYCMSMLNPATFLTASAQPRGQVQQVKPYTLVYLWIL